MKKYEYKVMQGKDPKHAEQIMNEMSNDGWRVVDTAVWRNFTVMIIITFEREH